MTDNQFVSSDDPYELNGTVPMQIVHKETGPHGEEVIAFAVWRWDVTAAKAIAAGSAPNAQLNVQGFRSDLRQCRNMIDKERALAPDFDASQPLITTEVNIRGTSIPLILDGWNRLYRAYRMGIAFIDAYNLSSDEERQVRLTGPWWELDR
jgi:hypothetical protein